MEALKVKLAKIFNRRFPRSKLELETLPSSGRFTGELIWPGFRNMSHPQRQEELWKVLRQELSKEERSKVSGFFPYTSKEIAHIKAAVDED